MRLRFEKRREARQRAAARKEWRRRLGDHDVFVRLFASGRWASISDSMLVGVRVIQWFKGDGGSREQACAAPNDDP